MQTVQEKLLTIAESQYDRELAAHWFREDAAPSRQRAWDDVCERLAEGRYPYRW